MCAQRQRADLRWRAAAPRVAAIAVAAIAAAATAPMTTTAAANDERTRARARSRSRVWSPVGVRLISSAICSSGFNSTTTTRATMRALGYCRPPMCRCRRFLFAAKVAALVGSNFLFTTSATIAAFFLFFHLSYGDGGKRCFLRLFEFALKVFCASAGGAPLTPAARRATRRRR